MSMNSPPGERLEKCFSKILIEPFVVPESDAMRIAIVTKDDDALRDAIVSNKPSPITYNAPKPKEITDEDRVIEQYKIVVKPAEVMIVRADKVIQQQFQDFGFPFPVFPRKIRGPAARICRLNLHEVL